MKNLFRIISFLAFLSVSTKTLYAQPTEYKLTQAQVDKLIKQQEAVISKYESASFNQLLTSDKNAFMIARAKEVVLTFGPEWYRSGLAPSIIDTIKEVLIVDSNEKRTHKKDQVYVVNFPYDSTKEFLYHHRYITKVSFLKSTGQLLDLEFISLRRGLFFGGGKSSFEEMKKLRANAFHYVPRKKQHPLSDSIWVD